MEKIELKVDDEVKMSDIGKQAYGDYSTNPHHLNGIIIKDDNKNSDGYKYKVRWSNGESNDYRLIDIELVDKFVLPETWHVIVTEENREMLAKWRDIKLNESHINKYIVGMVKVGMVNGEGGIHHKGHNPVENTKSDYYDFGIRITTKQLIKYVLKEDIKAKVVIKPLKTFELGPEKLEIEIFKDSINFEGVELKIDDIKQIIKEYELVNK